MYRKITWDFEISNEEEVNSFLSFLESESKFTANIRDEFQKQYVAFLKLQKVLEISLDKDKVDPVVKKDGSKFQQPSINKTEFKDFEEYVEYECYYLKKLLQFEMDKLCCYAQAKCVMEDSKNPAELEQNLILAKSIVNEDRLPESFITGFITRAHYILTRLCFDKMVDNNCWEKSL